MTRSVPHANGSRETCTRHDGAAGSIEWVADLDAFQFPVNPLPVPGVGDVQLLNFQLLNAGIKANSVSVHVGAGRDAPRAGGELSMGMTNDLEIAIREGSTMVRVGTALFGERLR